MSTTYATELDVSTTPPVPLSRLVRVETRKMTDTKAGLWLLIVIGVVTTLIALIFTLAAPSDEHTFINYMGVMGTPQGFLLPVLGILLLTQEWGQRTGMVTFVLEPHRGKVIGAKVLAALIFGLAAVVLAMMVAALMTAFSGSASAWNDIGPDDFAKFGLLQVTGVLQGLAFGLLFINTAAAIVTFFILPTAFSIVSSLWGWLNEAQSWIDLGTSQQPLYSAESLSGQEWAQLGTGVLIWVVLPLGLGLWRMLRAEVK